MPTVPRLDAPKIDPIGIPTVDYSNKHTSLDFSTFNAGVDQLAGAIDTHFREEREKEDATKLRAASNEYNRYANDRQYGDGGSFTLKGKGAVGVRNATMTDLNKERDRISEGLDDDVKEQFLQFVDRSDVDIDGRLNRYETEQWGRYQQDETIASLDTFRTTAIQNHNDPQAIEDNIDRGLAALSELDAMQGRVTGDHQSSKKMRDYVSSVRTGIADRIIQESPENAADYLTLHRDDFTDRDYAAAETTLRRKLRADAAERQASHILMGTPLSSNGYAPQKVYKSRGGSKKPKAGELESMVLEGAGMSQDELLKKLVPGVTFAESGDGKYLQSEAGALGWMQVMPATGAEQAALMGVPFDAKRLRDDKDYNIAIGTAYLGRLLNQYDNNPVLALAAYNAGAGRVDEWIAKYGDPRTGKISNEAFIAAIPFKETRDYVPKVLQHSGVALSTMQTETPARTSQPIDLAGATELPGYLRTDTPDDPPELIRRPEQVTDRPAAIEPNLNEYLGRVDRLQASEPDKAKVRASVVGRYMQWREANKRTFDKAFDAVTHGETLDDLPVEVISQLTEKQHKILIDWNRKTTEGVIPQTDYATFSALMRLAANKPNDFLVENLTEYKPNLSGDDYQRLTEVRESILEGKPQQKLTTFITAEKKATMKFEKVMGWKADDGASPEVKASRKQRTDDFLLRLQENVQAIERSSGKTASDEDINQQIDAMLTQVNDDGDADEVARVMDIELSSIPQVARVQIVAALDKAKLPATTANIKMAYYRMSR